MHSLQLVSNNLETKIHPINQKLLDHARLTAMEELLNGGLLEQGVTKIAYCLENMLEASLCQVLLYASHNQSFRPMGTTSSHFNPFLRECISQYFPQNHIDEDGESLKKAMLISANIHQSDAWATLQQSATDHSIQANWTLPIVSSAGVVSGLVSVFFNSTKMPTNENLAIVQQGARTLAALITHAKSKTLELRKQLSLHQQLENRQNALNDSNGLLKKALAQRTEVQSQLIELENMAALGTMMSSLTHEMNTPIGVAITAASFLHDVQQMVLKKLQDEQLKKSELVSYFNDAAEASIIIERNLSRADELIKTFKQLSIDQHSQDLRSFNLCEYVYEVLLSLKPRLKATPHKFCIDVPADLTISSNAGAISQLLINLIMNSAQHAFPKGSIGQIIIKARLTKADNNLKNVQIDYYDNGIGMNEETIENIYKPFFTLARDSGGSGLGMHICNNIVMKVLRGNIDCQSQPGKGVHFSLNFPI
ncbi:sensor histidine kinase [Paraglaciecola hydrolytica]|nr:HAMP domain-containing sensor histidine kinase [Paraglaciecola hydrolytica]